MGFLDAIFEGIGNVVLVILGIIVLIIGVSLGVKGNEIIGFIFVIIGLGMIAAKYKRQ